MSNPQPQVPLYSVVLPEPLLQFHKELLNRVVAAGLIQPEELYITGDVYSSLTNARVLPSPTTTDTSSQESQS